MRAIVVGEFGPPEGLRVAKVPTPVPGPGEVLVTVHAAPVNYVDMLVVGGTYQFLPPFPFIPGKGPAGVVTALGPGVTTLRVGDRVLAMAEVGGYAEAVAVAADQCHRLPAHMSFAEAASAAVVYDTSWVALRGRARLSPGESVLVLGASGGVGHAAVQLARALGAGCVLAGISRPEREAAVRANGADAVIDLSRPDLRDSLREQVYAETDGRGADIIIDPLGGTVFEAAIRALAWCGRLVVIGFAAGGIPTLQDQLPAVEEHRNQRLADHRLPEAPPGRIGDRLFRDIRVLRAWSGQACRGNAVSAGAGGRRIGRGARPPDRRPRRVASARRLNREAKPHAGRL